MLEKFLEKQFGITKATKLPVPIPGANYSLVDLLGIVKKRNTENNVINNIKTHGYETHEKQEVITYLAGVAYRLNMDGAL